MITSCQPISQVLYGIVLRGLYELKTTPYRYNPRSTSEQKSPLNRYAMTDFKRSTNNELRQVIDDETTAREDLKAAMQELHRRDLKAKEIEIRYELWRQERVHLVSSTLPCSESWRRCHP